MRRSSSLRGLIPAAALFISSLLLAAAGCERAPAAQAPPPTAVTVSHPIQQEVIEWDEYTGHLESPDSVDLRAQVNGSLLDAPFQEGSIVKKGALLFAIDDRPFKADLDAKKATLAQMEAQLTLNQLTLRRYEKAEPGAAVSQQDVDIAKANVKQAQAQVAGAEAAVAASQLNVDWCRVVAPITGRVSRKNVTAGNLVTAGGAGQGGTLLTTLHSVDPIYHYVDVDERAILKYARLAAEKKRVSARDAQIPVFMELLDETGFPHVGYVDFVDNIVDPTTGTLRGRGVFPNPDGRLTPGFFGRAIIPGSGRYMATLVPDAAIGADQNIRYVAVIDKDNIAHFKTVEPGALFGQLRAIVSGVELTDMIVTNGLVKVRPGIKVSPIEQQIDASSFHLKMPGSPATQALPQTRPTTSPATMSTSAPSEKGAP